MRTVQAVIFDMDGLMVDTELLHHQSFSIVLERHGIVPVPNREGVIHVSGISAEDNWERFRREFGLSAGDDELSREKHRVHLELLARNLTAMPGLLQLIERLRSGRVAMAIASSSVREHVELVVRRLGIRDVFDAIVSGDEVEHGKPCPDIFLRAAELLQIEPGRCVVLEDAASGVRAGRNAGMTVIAVPNRFTRHEDFAEADRVVASLADIDARLLDEIARDS